MNPFDHFVKERLRVEWYVRYTDDFILLHENREMLVSLLAPINAFLKERLELDLHPKKISLRKASQGVDFLGYVALPGYRRLRTKTKRRIFRRSGRTGLSGDRLQSYLGLLSHCEGYELERRLRREYLNRIPGRNPGDKSL